MSWRRERVVCGSVGRRGSERLQPPSGQLPHEEDYRKASARGKREVRGRTRNPPRHLAQHAFDVLPDLALGEAEDVVRVRVARQLREHDHKFEPLAVRRMDEAELDRLVALLLEVCTRKRKHTRQLPLLSPSQLLNPDSSPKTRHSLLTCTPSALPNSSTSAPTSAKYCFLELSFPLKGL